MPCTKSLGLAQLSRYVKSELFTGIPRPINSWTRGSAQPTRKPTQLPKLKPPTSNEASGKFLREEIDGGLNVSSFTQSAVVCPSAEARAAKIETQNGNAEGVDGFRGLVDDFVVQECRQRVDADGRMTAASAGVTGASGSPENGFELPSGPLQKEIARIVMNLHRENRESP